MAFIVAYTVNPNLCVVLTAAVPGTWYREISVDCRSVDCLSTGEDCSEGCDDLQRGALEMLGHLAGMAEWISPFQPHQVCLASTFGGLGI